MNFYTNCKAYGNSILLREIRNGQPTKTKIKYNPTIYIPTNTNIGFKTMHGQYVSPLQPGSIKETKEFITKNKFVKNFNIYGDIAANYKFLAEEYPTQKLEFDVTKVKTANIDIETISSNGFPYAHIAAQEITAITVKYSHMDTYFAYGCQDFDSTKNANISYIKCIDEHDLLTQFCLDWNKESPDIVTGWNVEMFDIPYIVNRCKNIFSDSKNPIKLLSPWKMVHEKSKYVNGKPETYFEIVGVSTLDYIQLYKKHIMQKRESYKLDFIAHVELNDRKLDFSEYSSLQKLYENDYQKFIEYNVKDVEIVDRLEKKLRLINMVITLSYFCRVNYDDTFSQMKMWDQLIHVKLLAKNIVIPPKNNNPSTDTIIGAFVKEPVKGKHKWMVSFDLNSLYPNLIRQYNISPETIIEHKYLNQECNTALDSIDVNSLLNQEIDTTILHDENITLTPNSQYWSKKKIGFLPEIMAELYADRVGYKKQEIDSAKALEKITTEIEHLKSNKLPYKHLVETQNDLYIQKSSFHLLQWAVKITLNSAYGSLGNAHFRYYDHRLASAVTTSGQLSILWAEKDINNYLNTLMKNTSIKEYVKYVDTDSIYVCLEDLINKVLPNVVDTIKIVDYIDKISSEIIEKVLEESYAKLYTYMNAFDDQMVMKRENICDTIIFQAKKRYLLNVYDSEGVRYDTPQLKMKGIEAVRSSTPMAVKEGMKNIFDIFMNKTELELQEYVKVFKKNFMNLNDIDIFFPRSVNGVKTYADSANIYKKGTPIAVKGALIYNHYIKEKKLTNKYQLIQSGDKIKFCYLKVPNKLKNAVISVPDDNIPEEFDILDFVDKETQFEKVFLNPLEKIAETIGWNMEKRSTLSTFFS